MDAYNPMPVTKDSTTLIAQHIEKLKGCKACPLMVGPVITGRLVVSKIYLIGQAPGPREGEMGRPFAWTAGKTLFKWFDSIGVDEETFRSNVYMAAVCRCFPGKAKTGGDRVPDNAEIKNCSEWMQKEFDLLSPELVLPVGKLAIEQFFGKTQLASIIGTKHRQVAFGHKFDIIPLPHPSGASTWHRMEPGKTLLAQALALIAKEPYWKAIARKSSTEFVLRYLTEGNWSSCAPQASCIKETRGGSLLQTTSFLHLVSKNRKSKSRRSVELHIQFRNGSSYFIDGSLRAVQCIALSLPHARHRH